MGVKVMEARRKTGKSGDQSFAALDAYAEAQFRERIRTIESELLSVEGGRFDDSVGVSIGQSSKPGKKMHLLNENFDRRQGLN
jgi:hypothetical protein